MCCPWWPHWDPHYPEYHFWGPAGTLVMVRIRYFTYLYPAITQGCDVAFYVHVVPALLLMITLVAYCKEACRVVWHITIPGLE